MSGCYATSALKGFGKVKPLKVLLGSEKYLEPLSKLGDTWSLPDTVLGAVDSYTCSLYGKTNLQSVNAFRYTKMVDLCPSESPVPAKNIDLASLPPCRRSLTEHVKRANYQVAIWKRAMVASPEVPAPEGHGWTTEDGKLTPKWFDGPLLPQELVDVADSGMETDESEEDSDDEIDFSPSQFQDSDSDDD